MRLTSGRAWLISSIIAMEVKQPGRITSKGGLELLLSSAAISCEYILELSPTRTRIEISSATWRGRSNEPSPNEPSPEGLCCAYLCSVYTWRTESGFVCRYSIL